MRAFLRSTLALAALLFIACGDDAPPTEDPVCTEDAQCDDGIFCNGTETCSPSATGASALGCVAGANPCPANEACIETMATCDDSCSMPDGDGDGVDRIDCGGDDCDDMDADRYPGNTEICDAGHDEDCDLNTVGTLDRDRDGFIDARCSNDEGAAGTDCNDLEVAISPSASEVCNGRDDDCDGDVDEGVAIAGFADADADGRGDSTSAMNACPGTVRFAILGEDCDDADIAVQPVQNEICDVKDNDCDGTVDEDARPALWYEDADGDGYGDVNGDRVVQCTVPAGYSLLPTDCNDADDSISPLAVEACNAIDDDCNGVADFPVPGAGFEDDDQDGIPDSGCGGGDCDDLDPFVGAGLPEYCNGRDDDCDGMVDEGLTETDYYADADGDGYGVGAAMPMCADIPGVVPRSGDCNDADPGTTPGAKERCDNIDNDCDGMIDEGASTSCVGPNADYTCVDGFCEIADCRGTFGDCDFRASTGCETNLATAANHCGLCGATCGTTCTNGVCDGGDTSPVMMTVGLRTTGGAPILGMPVFAPETAPTRSGESDMDGTATVTTPGLTPVAAGGGGCYPTLYSVDVFGGVGPYMSPGIFSGFDSSLFVDTVTPLELTELEIFASRTSPQLPNRGIVLVAASDAPPAVPGAVTINLAAEGPVGLQGTRPLTTAASDLFGAGGMAVDATVFVVFTNVEPGPLQVVAEGCRVDYNPGFVRPGIATIVTMECVNPSAG